MSLMAGTLRGSANVCESKPQTLLQKQTLCPRFDAFGHRFRAALTPSIKYDDAGPM